MIIKCNGVVSHGSESSEGLVTSGLARRSATFTGAGPEGSATLPSGPSTVGDPPIIAPADFTLPALNSASPSFYLRLQH